MDCRLYATCNRRRRHSCESTGSFAARPACDPRFRTEENWTVSQGGKARTASKRGSGPLVGRETLTTPTRMVFLETPRARRQLIAACLHRSNCPSELRPPKIESQPFSNRNQQHPEMQIEIVQRKFFVGKEISRLKCITNQRRFFVRIVGTDVLQWNPRKTPGRYGERGTTAISRPCKDDLRKPTPYPIDSALPRITAGVLAGTVPDDRRTALGDETAWASSQSCVAALRSRAVILTTHRRRFRKNGNKRAVGDQGAGNRPQAPRRQRRSRNC